MKILDDVLDLSRLEAGQFRIEYVETPIERLVDSASELMAAAVANKGLTFECHLSPDVPEKINCDPLRVGQVLTNLLNNAIKFTEAGKVELRVEPSEARLASGEDMVRFEVIDTGIGIPPSHHQSVFDSFTQADVSTTRKYGGSGMGLTISKHLAELLDGRIGFDSQEGVGSTFWFEIPVLHHGDQASAEPVSADFPNNTPQKPTSSAPQSLGARILVADDDPISRIVVTEMLQRMGHTVEKVQDGEEAVAAARRGTYDFVFMDCHMPRMDGIRATEILRADAQVGTIPIIALTAGVLETEQRKCLDAGMNAVVTKPVKADDLAGALQRWLAA